MQKITAAETLMNSILVLERKQKEEGILLREQFAITFESVKPVNILRKMISDLAEPIELKDSLVQTAAGLVSGYISRKLLVRSSKNPLLRFMGIYLQYTVTNFVSKNSDSIKALVLYSIHKLSNRSHDH